jgi:hypothetical protein
VFSSVWAFSGLRIAPRRQRPEPHTSDFLHFLSFFCLSEKELYQVFTLAIRELYHRHFFVICVGKSCIFPGKTGMSLFPKKHRISFCALILCVTVIAFLRLFLAPFYHIFTWDVFGYYLYLPAYFIYGDLFLSDFEWVRGIIETYSLPGSFYQAVETDGGNWVMRYPMGLALLNLPFFLLADLLAQPLGFARDGFSAPYQLMWGAGGMLYAFAGLILGRKVLLRFFSDATVALLLLVIVFATNFLQLATYESAFPHVFLFGLYSLVFFNIQQWKDKIPLKNAFITGCLIGLIAICRPNELVIILIPLFWNVGNGNLIQDRFLYLRRHSAAAWFFGTGLLLGGLPQLLYWKLSSGSWFFYSYRDNGVGFDFLSPHTWEFLFSYRKGFFVYTPVMLLSCAGFYFLWKHQRRLFLPVFLYFIVNLYVVSSWSVWWYAGGSYSSRSMVSSYLLMSLPLGCLITEVRSLNRWFRISFFLLLFLLTVLNLFQFWQFRRGILDGERMTKAYFWQVFAKTEADEGSRKLLLVERQTTPYENMPDTAGFTRKELVRIDFSGLEDRAVRPLDFKGKKIPVLVLDSGHIYSPSIEKGFREITKGEYAWLRIKAEVFVPEGPDEPPLLVVQFNHKERPYKYVTSEPWNDSVQRGQWHTLRLDYMTPEVRNAADKLKIYLWYRGKGPVYARSLEAVAFEPQQAE